jgi:hypothetical protein
VIRRCGAKVCRIKAWRIPEKKSGRRAWRVGRESPDRCEGWREVRRARRQFRFAIGKIEGSNRPVSEHR